MNRAAEAAESSRQQANDCTTDHYWDGGRRQACDIALHLLAENAGWPVVEGVPGVGKSWLLQRIIEQLGQIGIQPLTIGAQTAPPDLASAAHKNACLCLDDVSPDDPRCADLLEQAARNNLRAVLTGRPGLAATLSRSLDSNVGPRLTRINLRNLDRHETSAFARQLHAGAERQPRLRETRLYRRTGGNPAAVVAEWLAHAPPASKRSTVPSRPALFGVAAVLFLGILVVAIVRWGSSPPPVVATAPPAPTSESTIDRARPVTPTPEAAPAVPLSTPPNNPPLEPTPSGNEPMALTDATQMDAIAAPPMQSPTPTQPEPRVATKRRSPAASEPPSKPEVPQALQPATPSSIDPPDALASRSSAPTDATGYRREAWLLSLPANAAALQLMLHSEEDRVQQFIDRHGLHSRAGYYVKQIDGAAYYCLILGPFDDMAAADAARRQLSEPLRAQRPWRRPLQDIHADIAAARVR